MIELYILPMCPYCRKVLAFLDENNIEYVTYDINESQNEKNLIQLGGKSQVPYLVDSENNVQMYESDDIIAYVKSL